MGFLKKKPSGKGGELTRSSSTKHSSSSLVSPNAASSPSTSSLPTAIDEDRDDGLEQQQQSNKAEASAPRASRERPAAASREKSAGAQSASRPKKKSGTGSSSAAGPRKEKGASSSAKEGGAAKMSRAASPVTLGLKKAPGSEKKKTTKSQSRARSRSASADQGRGRSVTPVTPKATKAAAEKKAATAASASKKKASASGKVKTTPKVTNRKSRGRPASNSRGQQARSRKASVSRSASRTKSRPKSAPTPPTTSTRHSRRGVKKQHSADESSCSSYSGSDYSDDESRSYYSETDEYTTEMEDSTMYTDASGSFVSLGYNSTVDSEDRTREGGSGSFSDESNFSGDEGVEVPAPRSGKGRKGDSKGYSASFESNNGKKGKSRSRGNSASMKSASVKSSGAGKFGKMTKEGLSALGNLAEMATGGAKEEAATPKEAEDAASPSSKAEPEVSGKATAVERSLSAKHTSEDISTVKGNGSSTAPSTTSTYADFMKKMEGFEVKDEDHQLVVQVTEHGNVEKLLLQELSYIPKPTAANEILIKVDASTITLQDCMIRRGKWYEMQNLPFIPGSDVVGTIFEMGTEASNNSTFQVGDKVAAMVPSGGNAKYITMPYQKIIRVPNETDSVVALCLSSTYVPAREALDLARKLNTPFTGANVLVIGGNGPSGLATIELALLEGSNVFTTADERHHDYLTKMGAKCFPIDPNKWLPTLQGKMDVVLDSVCLDGYESSSMALNPAGTLVCTGMSAVYTQGQIRAFGLRDVRDYKAAYCKMRAKYLMNQAVYYDRMERYEFAPNEYAQHFRYLCHLASKDTIKPLVSSRTPLNLVAATQKAIEHGDTTYGVCICTPWTAKIDTEAETKP